MVLNNQRCRFNPANRVLAGLILHLGLTGQSLSYSASQEIPHTVWNPRILYNVHKSMPLVPILSQINPVQSPLHLPTWKWPVNPDKLWNVTLIKINEFAITFLNLLPLTIMYGRDLSVIISLTASKPNISFSPPQPFGSLMLLTASSSKSIFRES